MSFDIEEGFSWSGFYAFRREIRSRFPSIYDIKLRKKLLDVLGEELRGGEKILDVGAAGGSIRKAVQAAFPSVLYKTMDVDRAHPHDYYDLGDIRESFDLVILSEVIEHMEFAEGMRLLVRLLRLLREGGTLVVSTPNLHHPNRFWRDVDHKTPYHYEVLGGALLSAGFRLERIYRIYNDQFLRRFFRIHIASGLHRYLDVDFANSIVAVARR